MASVILPGPLNERYFAWPFEWHREPSSLAADDFESGRNPGQTSLSACELGECSACGRSSAGVGVVGSIVTPAMRAFEVGPSKVCREVGYAQIVPGPKKLA